jgi:N-acyl-D-amino-acid deacylase
MAPRRIRLATLNLLYYPQGDRQAPCVFPANGEERKLVPAAYGGWCIESMDAHGGWIASAPELVRFASALDDAEQCPILKASSIRGSSEEITRSAG